MSKLIIVLNDTNEWGQIYILELVSKYVPEDKTDLKKEERALEIIDRVKNRLAHSNHGLVITTVKTICSMLVFVTTESELRRINDLFSPPLMSMMNSE